MLPTFIFAFALLMSIWWIMATAKELAENEYSALPIWFSITATLLWSTLFYLLH